MDITKTKGLSGLYLCCEDRRNRETCESDKDNIIEICKLCRRRHFTMIADVGVVGIEVFGQ